MPAIGPTLETERLILRPPIQADLDAWAANMADPEVQRHLGGVQPRSVAWRAMATTVGSWGLQGFGMFSVLRKDSGAWIGRVGPHRPEGWPGDEVGWGLAREAWGQGYAYEAAAAAMTWAVDSLLWREIVHCIDPANTASITLAKRLGSRRTGPARMPPPHDRATVDLYVQTAEQWQARP